MVRSIGRWRWHEGLCGNDQTGGCQCIHATEKRPYLVCARLGEEQRGLEKWPALLSNIRRGRCTPILGPGLTESLLGSRRDIAQRWAETYHFPMAPHDREDLPQVAQYLAVNQQPMFPRDELMEHMRQEMLRRYGGDLSEAVRKGSLDELMTAVGAQRRELAAVEPHQVLAGLPLSIYITTDVTNLLADALTAAGKEPQVELCRWNEDIAQLPSIYDQEPNYRPDDKRPLVYHLFGRLHEPDSLILTEDDYFDYLIGVTSNKDLIPGVVRGRWPTPRCSFWGSRWMTGTSGCSFAA